jgi:hypothetical protein
VQRFGGDSFADLFDRPSPDLYYLVRTTNACGPPVGEGWGRDSSGAQRPACP